MSTTPTPTPAPSKVDRLLSILQLVLGAGSTILGATPVGGAISLADVALGIIGHAKALYEQETGQPLDLSKIPTEANV
jgi:hypothetical protein